jgi:hypothetical protein
VNLSFDTIIPYAAGVDLSAFQYRCVKDNGAGQAVPITADTDAPIGILVNKPLAGASCTLETEDVVKGVLGGPVSKGDFLGPDATGALVKRVPGTDTTKYIIGRSGDAGVASDIVPVRLADIPFRAA